MSKDKKYNTEMQRILAEREANREYNTTTQDYKIEYDETTNTRKFDTAFPFPDGEYSTLLKEFMHNKKLQKMLELCIINESKYEERERILTGRYPEQQRNLLTRLLYELQTARAMDDLEKQEIEKEKRRQELAAQGGKVE